MRDAFCCPGADKVSVNTAAVRRPELISELSREFGAQAVVLAIDAGVARDCAWNVYTKGGRVDEGIDAIEWAKRGEQLGAGEILLTSMDTDGVQTGFDCSLTREVSRAVKIPVIASGGAGKPEDFLRVFEDGEADAALAASIFHYGTYTVDDLKQYLEGGRRAGQESDVRDHSLHRPAGPQGRSTRAGPGEGARRRKSRRRCSTSSPRFP